MGTRIHEALEVRDPSALHDEQELDIYNQCCEMEDAYLAENMQDLENATQYYEVQVDVALDGTSTYGTCDRLTISPSGKFGSLR